MESFIKTFDKVLDYCKSKFDKECDVGFKLWLKSIQPVSLNGKKAVLSVESEMHKGIIKQNYENMLHEAFEKVLGFDVDIDITII